MSERRGGVSARNYVVHLMATDVRTLCGRIASSVNVSDDASSREELCKVCANRMTDLPEQGAAEAQEMRCAKCGSAWFHVSPCPHGPVADPEPTAASGETKGASHADVARANRRFEMGMAVPLAAPAPDDAAEDVERSLRAGVQLLRSMSVLTEGDRSTIAFHEQAADVVADLRRQLAEAQQQHGAAVAAGWKWLEDAADGLSPAEIIERLGAKWNATEDRRIEAQQQRDEMQNEAVFAIAANEKLLASNREARDEVRRHRTALEEIEALAKDAPRPGVDWSIWACLIGDIQKAARRALSSTTQGPEEPNV